jgi:group I intron endonuclease
VSIKSGIYKITNTIDNKVYYGSSENIIRRWRDHKSCLRRNCHHSKYLQHAWNKYGEGNFIFEIVCLENDQEKLLVLEQKFIDDFDSTNPKNGYNISKIAGSAFKNMHHSEETKRIQSEKNSGSNHWAYGKHLSEDHKELISTIKRKIPKSEETSIVEQYKDCKSAYKIAKKYNVHAETIYRILRRNGFSTPRKK